jgi:hypothetical protein
MAINLDRPRRVAGNGALAHNQEARRPQRAVSTRRPGEPVKSTPADDLAQRERYFGPGDAWLCYASHEELQAVYGEYGSGPVDAWLCYASNEELTAAYPHNSASVAAGNGQTKVSIAGLTAAKPLPKMSPLELRRIMPLKEAAKFTGMSVDTLQRHHADKIRRLSPRRLGMRVADALQIGGR